MLPLALLALAALACAVAFARSRVPRLSGTRRVPQPLECPYLGSTLAALKDSTALRERLHAKHGPIVASTFLGTRYVNVRGFADVRKILLSEHDAVATQWPPAIRALLGEGSVSTTHFGDHKRLRAALAPVFAPRAVAATVPAIASILTKHVNDWVASGPGIEGARAIKKATFEIIVDVGMGFPPHWSTPASLDRFSDLFEVWQGGFAPGARAALKRGLEARAEMITTIEEAVFPAVAARRAAPLPARPLPASTLDRLTDATDDDGSELSPTQLATVALNLLFAGHETSSQILTLLLRTLHPHGGGPEDVARPDLLAALRAEQEAVMAAHGTEITQASLDAAPLAAACVKEQLRLTPVVGQVFRSTLKPMLLDGGRVGVPAGETVVLDLEHTIANDARWADQPPSSPLHPSKFEPRRWLDGGLDARKEGAYLPFAGGARYCVGWALAQAELAAALAVLASGYTWRLASPAASLASFPKPRLPIDGLVMTVEAWEREE